MSSGDTARFPMNPLPGSSLTMELVSTLLLPALVAFLSLRRMLLSQSANSRRYGAVFLVAGGAMNANVMALLAGHGALALVISLGTLAIWLAVRSYCDLRRQRWATEFGWAPAAGY